MSELKLTQQQIDSREWDNNGTAITGHEEFDKNGYLVVKDLIDATEFNDVFPEPMGKYEWFDDNIDNFNHESDEGQVHGCTSRRNYPPHKPLHDKIGRKLEKILGRKLYPTYQFDRFYSPGQQLWTHLDRDTCEISCTIHINTNVTECADVVRAKWCEISFTLQGSITEIILKEHQSYYSHVCQYAITWLLHIPICVTDAT